MLRTSLLIMFLMAGMLACAKPKMAKPAAKSAGKQVLSARTIEKAPKPSPYIYKAPRQVSAVNRDPASLHRSRPQPD